MGVHRHKPSEAEGWSPAAGSTLRTKSWQHGCTTHLLPFVDTEDPVGVVPILPNPMQLDGVLPPLVQVLICNVQSQTSLPAGRQVAENNSG